MVVEGLKTLIAIKSCARDAKNGFNDVVRRTWVQDIRGANYCFVLGQGTVHTHPDELILDCPDNYESLPLKTRALLKWAHPRFDHIFLCDTDTFVVPKRLLESDFYKYDYLGYFNGPVGEPSVVYGSQYAWASGGSGYWLSQRAAKFTSEQDTSSSLCPELRVPCEDLWVGQVLGPKIKDGSVVAKHDSRYHRGYRDDFKVDISAHYCSTGANRKFDPEWMLKHYAENR